MLIISDVHGNLELLKGLLDNVKDKDIYFVGDLVDRGPDSIRTLQFVMENGYKVVRGNHEDLMLNFLKLENEKLQVLKEKLPKDIRRMNRKYEQAMDWWYNCGGEKAHDEYNFILSEEEKKDILEYLENLPYYFYLEKEDIFISHAGLRRAVVGGYQVLDEDDNLSPVKEGLKSNIKDLIESQRLEDFIWIRDDFINRSFTQFETVFIAGHTPTQTIAFPSNGDKILRLQNKLLIDCGSFFSGVLAGIEINNDKVTAHYYSKEKGYYFEELGNLRGDDKRWI